MPKAPSRTRRIMIVDDEPDFVELTRSWIEPSYELVGLGDGSGLAEQIEALEPELVILDVRLPGLDGFKLCKRLRADQRFRSLPILFLTASHSDIDFFRNIESGGTAYMTKPVTRVELMAKIKELLDEP